MCSKTGKRHNGTAAWKISLWSSLAFALGTAIVFLFLQRFLAHEIQNHADSWLTGELGVLADVAEQTPASQLHDTVVREVAELASREAPRDESGGESTSRAVLFLRTTAAGKLTLYSGAVAGPVAARAISASTATPTQPADVRIPGYETPFRVAEATLDDGDRIYLALSSEHECRVLHRLRTEFATLWLLIIALGSFIVYVSTRRMLGRVQAIIDTAETIGRTNLRSRVPATPGNDEISRLSLTLNHMLDRVEGSVQQLHAMSDALAHDLRSPLTSLRGRLELALTEQFDSARESSIGHCIEELDRLSSLLDTSLDVSEASVDALRLRKELMDLDATVRSIVELYEPAFAQAGLALVVRSDGPAPVLVDPALVQRTLANLLDNDLKHLRPGCTVMVSLTHQDDRVQVCFEDTGAGFPPELLPRIFERYTKGAASTGHGLGLAFVSAVVRSHDGSAIAENRPGGGAAIRLYLPLAPQAAPAVHAGV